MTAPAAVGVRVEPQRRSVAARSLCAFVRGYQAARAGRPSPCRYWPTCSEYALEAIEAHGAWRGGWLAARRLGRCHPWGGKGIDLVPEPAVPEPAVPEPAVPEPAVPEPAVPEPAVAEPAVAEPAVAEPAVAEPAVATVPERSRV